MNLSDIRTEKKQILADIKALRERYDKFVKHEKELKRQHIKSGHCCIVNGCYELTSRKTTLAKLGQWYKECDGHRMKRKMGRLRVG